jgi:hypothetical protein
MPASEVIENVGPQTTPMLRDEDAAGIEMCALLTDWASLGWIFDQCHGFERIAI